ncbi:MAG: hypothetical protein ACRDVP_11840 [Acidimicrobiales bacterium]
MLRSLMRVGIVALGASVLVVATSSASLASAPGTHRAAHKVKRHAAHKATGAKQASSYCTLLSSVQVEQLMGTSVTSTEHHGDFSDLAGCTWRGANPNNVDGASVTVDVNRHGGTFPSSAACTPAEQGQAVPALGTEAFFCGIMLTAKKGSVAVSLEAPGTSASEADFVADVSQIFRELGTG